MSPAPEKEPAVAPEGADRLFRARRETLGRKERVRANREFQEAYAQGRRFHGRAMVMFLRSGEGAGLRLGVVSSRKVGNAVSRARARRRLREVFRRNRAALATGDDVILVARGGAVDAPFAELRKEFLFLARKAGILAEGRA